MYMSFLRGRERERERERERDGGREGVPKEPGHPHQKAAAAGNGSRPECEDSEAQVKNRTTPYSDPLVLVRIFGGEAPCGKLWSKILIYSLAALQYESYVTPT